MLVLCNIVNCDNKALCESDEIKVVCYPADCCPQYVQCSKSRVYPPQGVPANTVCKGGQIVHAFECSGVTCPEEKPDWGFGGSTGDTTGGSTGEGGSGGTTSGESGGEGIDPATGEFKFGITDHGNYALNLNPSNVLEDVKAVMKTTEYTSPAAIPSLNKLGCSFHPQWRNQNLQMLIGRPSGTTTLSMTEVKVRLPDKYFGMFLAYAQDQYGICPHTMISLASKETFATALYPQKDDSYFIVNGMEDFFDTMTNDSLFRDQNKDGPFQVESPAMSTDASVIPQRFFFGSTNVAKADRKPSYVTDNELLKDYNAFKEYHDSITGDFYRAIVLSSLDLHFRHNVIMRLPKQGMRDAWDTRSSDPESADALEFAAAMYTYNRGLFGSMDMSKCSKEMNPITDCKLDGFGGHSTDINAVCQLLNSATEIYDYPVTWSNTQWFMNKLEEMYPYESVNQLHSKIDWTAIHTKGKEVFDTIFATRKSKQADAVGISFRYDWRLMLAAIRAFLPPKEEFYGPTMEGIVKWTFNNQIASEPVAWADTPSASLAPYMQPYGTAYAGTAGPTTKAPTTQPPVTTKTPVTQAPTTKAPVTQAPTQSPTTKAPTQAPTTKAPVTQPPTQAPTQAPTTKSPTGKDCPANYWGIKCYTDNCCPFFYQCSGGKSSEVYEVVNGGKCYNGDVVSANDCRCDGISCPSSAPATYCGDGTCQSSESCSSCPEDCGKCQTTTGPTTKSPVTQQPTTKAPVTQSPTTKAPTTKVPTTQSPTTKSPTIITPTSGPSGTSKYLVGYYTNWSQYRHGKGLFYPSNIDPTLFTHIMYGFGYIKASDYTMVQVEWNDVDEWTSQGGLYYQFNNHVHSKNPRCKTLIAIGGWNFNYKAEYKDIFTKMVESSANRSKFINSVIEWCRKYGFDGVDLDWEYPAVSEMGGRPQDKSNFILLLKELRAAMTSEASSSGKPSLLITCAVAAGKDKVDTAYDVPGMASYVDFISLMTYDLHGAWDAVTGGNANLYAPAGAVEGTNDYYYTCDYAVKYWNQKGMPKEKMVMGMAAYGRGWTLESSTPGQGMGAKAKGAAQQQLYSGEAGMILYYEILDLLASGGVAKKDEATKTMYIQKGDQWFSYENPDTISDHANYIVNNGLKGGMFWAIDTDDFNNGYPLIKTAYNIIHPSSDEIFTMEKAKSLGWLIPVGMSVFAAVLVGFVGAVVALRMKKSKHERKQLKRTMKKKKSVDKI